MITTLAALLIFWNLDNHYLWHDEAQTATISWNTLKYGYPRVWDGENLLTHLEGNDFNKDFVHIATPWMQFYVCAISLFFFGKTTFAARFPFALIGVIVVLVVWKLAMIVYKKKYAANLTALFLSIYVPFLLYARESRYYSLVFLFTALSTFFYMKLLYEKQNSRKRLLVTKISLVASIVSLFFSNYVACGAWGLAAFFHLFFTSKPKKWLSVGTPVLIGCILGAPWLFYLFMEVPSGASISKNITLRFLIFSWKVQTYFLPFITLLFIVLLFKLMAMVMKKGERKTFTNRSLFFPILVLTNILVVSIPEFYLLNHYLVALVIAIPFILSSLFLYFDRLSRPLAVIILCICLSLNIFNIVPYWLIEKTDFISKMNRTDFSVGETYIVPPSKEKTVFGLVASPYTEPNFYIKPLKQYLEELKIESYLWKYLIQLTHDYNSPAKAVVKILNEYGNRGEKVAVQGIEYEYIIYYTDMKVVNRLSNKAGTLAFYDSPGNLEYEFLTKAADDEIDWIILQAEGRPLILDDPNYLQKNSRAFKAIPSGVTDLFISNSPDLDYHKFVTDDNGPQFYILHRQTY